MAAIAVIDAKQGHVVTISELRVSAFGDWSSAVQYIAVCSCTWQEVHVVLHSLTTTASRHSAGMA